MTKFTSYDAPQGTAGPISVRSASAADFGGGIGEGLQQAGAAIGDFSKVLKEREDKRSITNARAQFSEFQIQYEQEEIARQASAPLGSTGHYETSRRAYDKGYAALTENFNDVQKNALGSLAASARMSNLTNAMRFQATNIVKGDLRDIGIIQKGIGGQLFKGTMDLEVGLKLFKDQLKDTTIGAAGQSKILTTSLPEFRKQVLDGLLQNPGMGQQKLDKGLLKNFPPEELAQFRTDLATTIAGAGEKAKQKRFASEISQNNKALDLILKGATLADLAKVDGLTSETRRTLQTILMRQNRPDRSIEEMSSASADMRADYTELGVTLKNGKRNATAGIEDLLSFQSRVLKQVNEGFLSAGEGRRYMSNVEEIVQGVIGSKDTGTFGIPWWDIIDDNPFNVGNEKIIAHVKKNNLGKKDHVNIGRRFNELLDKAGISSGADQTTSRDAIVNTLVEQAIKEFVQEKVPATKNMKDVPNAIVQGKKLIPGAEGQRDITKTTKIVEGTTVLHDPVSNTYARVTKDQKGNVIAVEPISKEDALSTKQRTPTPAAIPSPAELPPFDPTGGARPPTIPTEQEPEDTSGGPASLMLSLPPSETAIDMVQAGLLVQEGTGDTLTGIATGEGGITEVRKAEIVKRKGRPLSDKQARNEAVREDSVALHDGLAGFDTLGAKVQAAILDMTYNIGSNGVLDPVEFKSLHQAVAAGDVQRILIETLDTATVDGKSVSGLATRRARMYNRANPDPAKHITDVEQLNDGTINYLSGDKVLFTFKRPRHEKSSAGKVSVSSS
tara:strand:+ start:581 stop:2935 length:2355 start_codon:yes stop_codon:yes gene_type:complete